MSAEWLPLLHRGLLVLVALAGFQGLFREVSPVRKAAAWMVLQAGLVLLGLSLAPRPPHPDLSDVPVNPLTHGLALSTLLVSLGVLSALLMLGRGVRWKGPEPGEPGKDKRKAK